LLQNAHGGGCSRAAAELRSTAESINAHAAVKIKIRKIRAEEKRRY